MLGGAELGEREKMAAGDEVRDGGADAPGVMRAGVVAPESGQLSMSTLGRIPMRCEKLTAHEDQVCAVEY